MRDAFGGAFSIKLMIIFLMLYTLFICVALNYARAFRVKNRIINIIEQEEGLTDKAKTDIGLYLNERGYSIICDEVDSVVCAGCTCVTDLSRGVQGYSYKENNSASGSQTYYTIETYLHFKIPIIGIDFPIAVRGETRVIELP